MTEKTKKKIFSEISAAWVGSIATAILAVVGIFAFICEDGSKCIALLSNFSESTYQLKGTEFTLARGDTHFLPGGKNTLVYMKKAPSGTGNPILIKVNGTSRAMKTGDHFKIKDGNPECSLILLRINDNYKEVSFSYLCS